MVKHSDISDGGEAHGEPGAKLLALEHELAAGRARLAGLRAQLQSALSQLKSERAHAHDLAWELEELEVRLRDLLPGQGAGEPRLAQEHKALARRRSELEEQALAQLLRVDELAAQAAADERALIEHERAWAAREAQLAAERDRILGLLQG